MLKIRSKNHKLSMCKVCNARFTKKESLDRHMKTVHMNVRLNCDKCEKPFTRKWNLNQHMLYVHEGKESKYKCKECEFKTKRSDSL